MKATLAVLVLGTVLMTAVLRVGAAETESAKRPPNPRRELAARIMADEELLTVLRRARRLLHTGLNAGDGYGEVWIRDLNTFMELSVSWNDPKPIREALLTFFKFQGEGGDIVDGYIPEAKASVGYKYRKSTLAPGLLAHKNTVETDQEASLVQAVARYFRGTRDRSILEVEIGGQRVRDRLWQALEYVVRERFDSDHGLIWGATTADWGDVQPEHEWGVELDSASHRACDIYDNAMFLVALREMRFLDGRSNWNEVEQRCRVAQRRIEAGVRQHLWDGARQKFIPHVYLAGSPFPADFDEAAIWFHGGTAVAIEAGLLTPEEVRSSLDAMRENVRRAGAASIGLTVYPPYPAGLFRNKSMGPWSYQNGGDWCWFGGRMVRQLLARDLVEEAYAEIKPMVARVIRHDGFYEWWTRDNQPRGSGKFRGSAGVLGITIVELRAWAAVHQQPEAVAVPPTPYDGSRFPKPPLPEPPAKK